MAEYLDFRVSVGFIGHPKTKALRTLCGRPDAPLFLIALWAFVRQYHPDGDLTGKTDLYLESAIDWPGEPGAFIRALIEVKYIDGKPGKRRVHDWQFHNPWSTGSEARSDKGTRAALAKHGRTKEEIDRILKQKKKRRVLVASSEHAQTPIEDARGSARSMLGASPVSVSNTIKDITPPSVPPFELGGQVSDENDEKSQPDGPIKKTSRREQIGTRMSREWKPPQDEVQWAATEYPAISPEEVTAEFVDYWVGIPGKDGRKTDWPATWRNRVRMVAARMAKTNRNGNGSGPHRETWQERDARLLREQAVRVAASLEADEARAAQQQPRTLGSHA